MLALDTNVLLRFMIQDSPEQFRDARALLSQNFFVANTVWVETEWVLRSSYRMDRDQIAKLFSRLTSSPYMSVEDREGLLWAIGRFQAGADFADMMHLVASRGATAFASFDKALPKDAGMDSPVPVHQPQALSE